uniref:Uncharacterized protein n=1 Tax=Arundo donax TaxID=35708 RepID=A0A0A8Y681_ARUDO
MMFAPIGCVCVQVTIFVSSFH